MPTVSYPASPRGGLSQKVTYRVKYTDLVAAGTSETETLGSLPEDAEGEHVIVNLVEVFACPSMTALTIKVGTAADDDAFATAAQLISGPPSLGRKVTRGVWQTGSAISLRAVFTATGANFGNATVTSCTARIVEITVV